MKVLICDDHSLFRRGLRSALEDEPDMQVVGEAADGVAAVEGAEELQPDVVLMDVRLPRLSGIDAAERIRAAVPHVKVVMLTVSDAESDLYDAIRAGAAGYLLKDAGAEEVADAIRSVWAGHSRIAPSMASKLLTEFAEVSRKVREEETPGARLTGREMDVLRHMAEGRNNRDIARELFISENTVKNHVRNILEKLNLRSRMEAVVFAMREGLVEIDRGAGRPREGR